MIESTEQEELSALYNALYEDGFWVAEVAHGMAGVGDLRDLDAICAETGKEYAEVIESMGMGDIVSLTAVGTGTTRVAAVTQAWEHAKVERDEGRFPMIVSVRTACGLPSSDPHPIGTF